ncbi:hypothetical protein CISG_05573 [Coccidioides immitis RMSCC 3703]|uniref:Uncharacterized protein n=1 Tax=Coccidioides immitis RMSCC 3703 TaxID=454286 RepID=A0A0J8QVX5_COCIT|nr:hypothetical protein CISG_05573 [Coccidioides immitis RMSCC 3703]
MLLLRLERQVTSWSSLPRDSSPPSQAAKSERKTRAACYGKGRRRSRVGVGVAPPITKSQTADIRSSATGHPPQAVPRRGRDHSALVSARHVTSTQRALARVLGRRT